MSHSRSGLTTGRPCAFLACATLVAAAALAGCASGQARTAFEPQVRASSSPRYAAANGGYRIEIEDDGLPAQTPPPLVRRAPPDDPSEPFSPNYGRDPGTPAPPRKPLAETQLPPAPPAQPLVPPQVQRGLFAASR